MLWVFVGDDVSVYVIVAGRGYEQARSVLGEDFSGVVERDGWAPYRRFEHAQHQTCVAHLLRRAGELICDSVAGQGKIPHAVRRLLLDALAVRDAHHDLLTNDDVIDSSAVEITDDLALLGTGDGRENRDEMIAAGPDQRDQREHLVAEIARLQQQIDALLARSPTHAPNQKLLKYLANEREHLLTFLETPGGAATNWRAEQAIRPAVVNRKKRGWQPNRPRRRRAAEPEPHPNQPAAGRRPDRACAPPSCSTLGARTTPRSSLRSCATPPTTSPQPWPAFQPGGPPTASATRACSPRASHCSHSPTSASPSAARASSRSAHIAAGVGIGCAETAEHAAVANFAPDGLRGSAFGLLAALQSPGNLAASAIAGGLWTLVSPTAAFLYAAGWMLVAIAGLIVARTH